MTKAETGFRVRLSPTLENPVLNWLTLQQVSRQWMGDRSPFMLKLLPRHSLKGSQTEAEALAPVCVILG